MAKNLTQSFLSNLTTALLTVNNKYTTINYGGCGAFAKILNDILLSKGYNVKYVMLSRHDSTIRNINMNCSSCMLDVNIRNIADDAWDHIMLLVNGRLIDSTGIYSKVKEIPEFENYKLSVPLPVKCFNTITSPKYNGMWNRKFQRSLIPDIEKELQTLIN